MTLRRNHIGSERGAAALEFALVAPVVFFLLFGLIYGGLAVAAHLSLAHAASVGARYASMPIDPVAGVYPTTAAVEARIDDSTPFFTADACETTITGTTADNAPVMLEVACNFPNPMGAAISGLGDILTGSDRPDMYPSDLEISAHAKARRE